MRKAIIASAAALSLILAATSQSKADINLIAQGAVDDLVADWLPYWLAFHIAGSGSCNGWIWYSGDQVGGQATVEDTFAIVLSSKINGLPLAVWAGPASACDAYSVHMGP
jgi:hypothetical protein